MAIGNIVSLKKICLLFFALTLFLGCVATDIYRDPNMDFGSIQTIAVMPFVNLSREQLASERVKDVFVTMILATGSIYVIPQGEVAKGVITTGISTPTTPTGEDVIKLTNVIKADAVITGVVKEYGEIRSGTTASNVVSLSMQMIEAQTGRVVWAASSTKGGVGIKDRLFGGGGKPMNDITEKAIDDILNKLFN